MNEYAEKTTKRYHRGLDGLRALSVIAVMAYHLGLKGAQGGFLGVAVFFVISGYLITDQLIEEWRIYGRLRLGHFWLRRIRRLLPAMMGMLALTAVWMAVTDPARLWTMRGDFGSALLYFNNWFLIFHQVSYFDNFGPPSPIGHLWSLAIEEQFYLAWPLLLWIGLRFAPRRSRLLLGISAGIFLSVLAMAFLYEPGGDPSRVYYGTDTRAFGLLIGAALAVLWPGSKLRTGASTSARRVLNWTGALSLVAIAVLVLRSGEYDGFLYPFGFFLLSLLTALVIAVLVHPSARLGNFLGMAPLAWIGKRSYSLYLWHYPVIALSRVNVYAQQPSMGRIVLELLLAFLLAALSYAWIEEPIRQGRWRKTRKGSAWPAYRGGFSMRKKKTRRPAWIWIAVIVIFATAAYALQDRVIAMVDSGKKESISALSQPALIHAVEADSSAGAEADLDQQSSQSSNTASGSDITAIGDSVMVGVQPYLEETMPGIRVDGKVGRQMSQAAKIVDDLKSRGELGNRVVLELGTNGPFNSHTLENLLESLSSVQRVVLVTARVPKGWEDSVNEKIKEAAGKFANVKVFDWHGASEGKEDYFYPDGVHLKPEGGRYYASLLADTLQQ